MIAVKKLGLDPKEIPFDSGTWDDVMKAGTMLANEVIETLETNLSPVQPDLRTFEVMVKLYMMMKLVK